ncbi:transcriptional regulator, TetR family [Parvibaculum lavamentivorans DS-1]|uniref:Transcriptional regulator, TetR family n=1 Tax=Parvibaculum lavamentivorans (strain DS-1 / DSM 13023 / NCIMB 13966) TaxID=402881 RepID=A7HX70_PARL1|nr:TetR family transcriptional regulator [Parvibaculum lavamentivorans]ABS64503.1 transcriptional regulator, TetR family [Parvibaculum lavamentivorans DS-1]
MRLRGQKTTYHHGDLRRGLMEAAMTLIDIRGRHALTMREAARRAGVSEAAPYRHFANLDELLGAVAIEGYEILIDDLEAVGSAKAVRETYLAFARDFPGRYELMFGRLGDRKSATKRKRLAAEVAELTERAGGLAALHGEASLALAGLTP